MRADPADYELVAPRNLPGVLALLAQAPGEWLPIAGGTDVMVQYSAGKLTARKLVSIWSLPELRRIEVTPDEIQIGAGCTSTDLRDHEIVVREFPLLASAASWTGGIANQNRATLGGNIVNASPAADSLPALLVYEADLLLVSARGERRVPYADFHVGYRKTQLASDELIRAVCLPRCYGNPFAYSRKVGARNAQAISKVCLAALGRVENGVAADIRLAMGSVAPIPFRLSATEQLLQGKSLTPELMRAARASASSETKPIDDIRSTARYRSAVAGNLVAEFLEGLLSHAARTAAVQKALSRWNALSREDAAAAILPCFGVHSWARTLAARRPLLGESSLLAACDEVCATLSEADWHEAFNSHPRIGDSKAPSAATAQSAAWSGQEQRDVAGAADAVKLALAEANRAYEQKFGRIFIVCATGKSAPEILAILLRRMQNEVSAEFREASEEQRKIAHLRLKKWLVS